MYEVAQRRLAAALGALAFVACDGAPPPDAVVSEPVELAQAGPPAASETQAEPEVPAVPEPPAMRPPDSAAALRAARAVAEALRDGDPYARVQRIASLLPSLPAEAVPAVLDASLRDLSLNPGAAEIELLVRFWASHHPEEATRWAVDESPPGYRMAALLASLPLWAAADPQAALVAVREWEEKRPDVREGVQIGLVRGWFDRDPAELAGYLQRLGMGIARQRAISTYLRVLIQQRGPEAAMRWAESVPEDDATYKLNVVRQLGAALPLFDRDAARRWCEAQCGGAHGRDLLNLTAIRWVWRDGAEALAWLSTTPEGGERDQAVRNAFGEWLRRAPQQALVWMADRAHARGGELEAWLRPALGVYAQGLVRSSPAQAIAWAERIEDEKERERTLIRLARVWRVRDEAALEAWLRESPLSQEAREKVRSSSRGPGQPSG